MIDQDRVVVDDQPAGIASATTRRRKKVEEIQPPADIDILNIISQYANVVRSMNTVTDKQLRAALKD